MSVKNPITAGKLGRQVLGAHATYADWRRVSGTARIFYVTGACQGCAAHALLGAQVPRNEQGAVPAEFCQRVLRRMAQLFQRPEHQAKTVSVVFGLAFTAETTVGKPK